MNLVDSLRLKIDKLPDGKYSVGLRAVLQHIEAAQGHLSRGQADDDAQAFTDAIYRANQAYEGSIKEAYRVLAAKDPEHKRPFDIETYLAENNVFKPRVLSQFTMYRTQWRNPSAHDYTLSFDQSEAFMAITSVSAFANVLIDQIGERVAFLQVQEDVEKQMPAKLPDDDEPASLGQIVMAYLALFNRLALTLPIETDSQLYGSVEGVLMGLLQGAKLTTDAVLVEGRPERAGLLVEFRGERVLVEMKRSNTRGAVRQGLLTLEHSMALSGIKESVLFLYHKTGKMRIFNRPFMNGVVHLLVPIADAPAKPDESADSLAQDSAK